MAEEIDRRVRKTRAALLKALLELLDEYPYKEISVKMLTDKADIAKPTFYRNFTSIEEMLQKELDNKANIIFEKEYNELHECTYLDEVTVGLVQNWADNETLLIALYKAEMDSKVCESFARYSARYINILNKGGTIDINSLKLRYFSGGIYCAVRTWLLSGRKSPIKELSDIMALGLFPMITNKAIHLSRAEKRDQ
ncbi:transcriptional regulator, TetR family [Desulfuromusa kysingii]|uniref:Transcriptional regulator, TetR family n=1 Tax=Desulfuromusa kysingii TaxID=37625 RepID=A0A1H4BMH4_9BACT|nr:TetR/AcrR family transcriptional regulator [Desulfuromusa kysingii]SEA49363.1 transcriptional regulator, TetR family [Desulfuromusa kysingii]